MNEVGLNANWLRADLTHAETQEFAKEVLNHMRQPFVRLSGEVRRPLQSGGYPCRVHHLPSCQARRPEVAGHHHRGEKARRRAVLHQFLPSAGGLYRRHLRGAGHAGRFADAVYLRHRVPRLFGRETAGLEGGGESGAEDCGELSSCPITRFRPPTPSARSTATSRASTSPARSAASPTEVYSRITGYYRPVQNWNDGKAQEFKDRKLYDIKKSVLMKKAVVSK
jgi:hypothetical protein